MGEWEGVNPPGDSITGRSGGEESGGGRGVCSRQLGRVQASNNGLWQGLGCTGSQEGPAVGFICGGELAGRGQGR